MEKQNNEIASQDVEVLIDSVVKLPKEERQVVLERLEIYQGDLPHPDFLKGYTELYPDAAKRIIENGIAETEHRRKMEERYLNGNIFSHNLGQALGFIVAILIIVCGTFLIYSGHPITGSILAGTTAIGVIGLFTGQNNKNNKNE